MKNIVILAAGPPKPNRNRHLEERSGKTIIDVVIDACKTESDNLYAVVDKSNDELISHIKDKVKILHPIDQKIYSTFESALSIDGDTLMIVGDLINLRSDDVRRFMNTDYRSATCVYKDPWANHIRSLYPNLIRRGDTGDCMSLIAQEHKEEFLSNDTQTKAAWLFKQFYPYKKIDENCYNDIGTFMSFVFFKEIWAKPNAVDFERKGSVLFEHPVYLDND